MARFSRLDVYVYQRMLDEALVPIFVQAEPDTAAQALGAQFIVGPSYNERVTRLCNRRRIPYLPGCQTGSPRATSRPFPGAWPRSARWCGRPAATDRTYHPRCPLAAAARFTCVAATLKCGRFGGRLGCPNRAEVEAALATDDCGLPVDNLC
jgi:hypothetical protein